jgi:hypothetical protein
MNWRPPRTLQAWLNRLPEPGFQLLQGALPLLFHLHLHSLAIFPLIGCAVLQVENHRNRVATAGLLEQRVSDFTPADFIARLASLVPRPRANLTRYHGVFAPNSPYRAAIVLDVRKRNRAKCKAAKDSTPKDLPEDPEPPTAPLSWAQRLKRVFEIDISVCPRCGGTLRVIADVTDPDVIQTILAYLKQRAPPAARPHRAPSSRPDDNLFTAS